MLLRAPVALFVFKRPDLTARVFKQIAQARPATLLVVADGPRTEQEAESEMVRQTRAVVEQVTWPCRVLRNYADQNLGCKRRMASGLDWVFENVDEAIILEDDCFPADSMFRFCDELLERYRDDSRVVAISGSKAHCEEAECEYSYFFSKYFHCWGWASWRRVWKHYDVNMREWPHWYRRGQLRKWGDSFDERCYWARMFDKQYRGQFDTWDYQMVFNCWRLGGLVALPAKNLVMNIGFDPRATHTIDVQHPSANCPVEPLDVLRHPPCVSRDLEADKLTFRRAFARDFAGVHKWRVRLRHCWNRTTAKIRSTVRLSSCTHH